MPHDPGRSTAGSARNDEPQDAREAVAREAKDEAHSVASTAKHEAGRVADEVRDQTRDLALDARDEFKRHAEQQAEQLGHTVGDVGARMQALAEGRPEDAGRVQEVTSRIADHVQKLGHRMEDRGLEGTIDELRQFARRRPGAFLAGAAVLGFAASRITRGATDDANGDANGDGEGPRSRHTEDVASELPPPPPPMTPALPTPALAGARTPVPVPTNGPTSRPEPTTPTMRTDPVPGRIEP